MGHAAIRGIFNEISKTNYRKKPIMFWVNPLTYNYLEIICGFTIVRSFYTFKDISIDNFKPKQFRN
jgi:hypothetical protein